MAGIGIKLNRIFSKNSITANLIGYGYSIVTTIAPMFLVIGTVFLMNIVFDTASLNFGARQLFSATFLYIFIFSLLFCSPWNAVLSRYLSDVIYEERLEDIMPCFYVGLLINMVTVSVPGILFCVREYFVGHVDPIWIITGFIAYLSLAFIFYAMIFLSITKDYGKMSKFYLIGMLVTFGLACFFIWVIRMDTLYSMLLAMTIGFNIIACLEFAQIRQYFKEESANYRPVLSYLRKFFVLIVVNFLYTIGLFVHNLVFWTTDLSTVVVNCFVMADPYDMATCLAMFTNISASTIFISLVEMRFHDRYKAYFSAVLGGSLMEIEKSKRRMFKQLVVEIMTMARIQFIISVVVFLALVIVLPLVGFGGLIMQIYPCLAAAYFVVFMMYSSIILLYYFNDHVGLLLTTGTFFGVTLGGSIGATYLTPGWYGIGLFAGALLAWIVSYVRLRWLEKNIDSHVFCEGQLLKRGEGEMPSSVVYRRDDKKTEEEKASA